MNLPMHPIMQQSFAVIDQEIGDHSFSAAEYAIVRRVIHSTADFDFQQLLRFSPGAITNAIAALQQGCPIITDVGMVKQGVANMVTQTFGNPLISAVEQVSEALPGKTRTETGLLKCLQQFPQAIVAIGNAPTALLTLCQQMQNQQVQDQQMPANSSHGSLAPALVIGAPVGFISVVESKAALA